MTYTNEQIEAMAKTCEGMYMHAVACALRDAIKERERKMVVTDEAVSQSVAAYINCKRNPGDMHGPMRAALEAAIKEMQK